MSDLEGKTSSMPQSAAERRPAGNAAQERCAPLDIARLQLVAQTPEDKAVILELFFRMAEEFLATMRQAQRNNAFKPWKDAAHSLKGSAANLGMAALEEWCRKAEKAADASDE